MFHTHQWKRIETTYTPPQTLKGKMSEYLFERLVCGLTTVLWECEKCHLVKREEMLGKSVSSHE